ncbi:MAG TPA: methylmalonyl-CoA mutase family protein [Bacteroidota bacterium]|nr:methylmalonyl-CoA mutase family protein [Bacteroidota bacterium]
MSTPDLENEKKSLFDEFPRPLKTDWLQQATAELEGRDFKKALVWSTDEGIDVQPMYFREDAEGLAQLGALPGEAPFVRGATALQNSVQPWTIAQRVQHPDPATAALEIAQEIHGGATGVAIRCDASAVLLAPSASAAELQGVDGVAVQHIDDLRPMLAAIPEHITLDVQAGLSAPALLAMNLAAGRTPEHVEYDPLTCLLRHGQLPITIEQSMDLAADALRLVHRRVVGTTVLGVHADSFHNAGANSVQELAFAVAAGVEYIHQMSDRDITAAEVAPHLRFTFAVGSNFFMEIAKLRAARMLWAMVMKEFGVDGEQHQALRLHVRTSRWFATKYDPWVNMLRGTVESLAAAVGGADSMYTAPFDEVVAPPTEFSRRIARNVQLLLREESHINHVVDPAGGSYYIETLTAELADKAWALFQDVEAEGGFLAAMRTGFLQEHIAGTAAAKSKRYSQRKDVLIGTNQYPNPGEQSLPGADVDADAVRATLRERFEQRNSLTVDTGASLSGNLIERMEHAFRAGATLAQVNDALLAGAGRERVTVLPQFRAAEQFEQLRDAVAAMEKAPVVFLATLGPGFWRRARATFASGFFGIAGLRCVDNAGFESAEQAAQAAVAAGAKVVVLCSDDESYPALAPAMTAALRQAGASPLLLVAGYPKDAIEQLRADGVYEFIHLKADAGETLVSMLEALGVDVHGSRREEK